MQVFSIVSTPPAADTTGSGTGSGSVKTSNSFADKLGASIKQDAQSKAAQKPDDRDQTQTKDLSQNTQQTSDSQQTKVAQNPDQQQDQNPKGQTTVTDGQQTQTSQEATTLPTQSIDPVPPQVQENEIPVLPVQQDVSTTQSSQTDAQTEVVATANQPQSSGIVTEKTDKTSDGDEKTESKKDSQEQTQTQEPQMVYLSPLFFGQMNLNSSVTTTTTNTTGLAATVTDAATAKAADQTLTQLGGAAQDAAAQQPEFAAVIGTEAAAVPTEPVLQKQTNETSADARGQTAVASPTEQGNGENLITRIAQAMQSQDDSAGASTDTAQSGIPKDDDSASTTVTGQELQGSPNVQTFTVQVQDGSEGKATAVNEIIDRFTQDFKGSESCPGELKITLTPENLGEIKISVRMSESGGVTAHITAKDKEISSLISSQIGRLVETMERKGVTVENVDVSYDQMNYQSSGQSAYQDQRQESSNRYQTAYGGQSVENDDSTIDDSVPEQFVNTNVINTGSSLKR